MDDQTQFISQHPPFSYLDESELHQCIKQLRIAHIKAGEILELTRYGGLLLLRSGSVERRNPEDTLLDKLSAGACFTLTNNDKSHTTRCLEDGLVYLFPHTLIDELSPICQAFGEFFSADQYQRLAQTIEQTAGHYYLDQRVENIMTKSPVCIEAKTSIQDAAIEMSERKISSLIVMERDRLVGIMTDRDLRTRVIAAGIDAQLSVKAVMTERPLTVKHSQSVYDAQLLMMGENIHHLPVMSGRVVVGMITLNDFVKAQNSEPVYLIHAISRASNRSELQASCEALPRLIDTMIRANVRAQELGRIITTITDAVTKRLIKLAETSVGELPCAYAWVVFGSQARADQMLGSDQDNGLILERELSEDEDLLAEQFARFVNDGLDECGLRYCPGGIMAMNPKWRQPLEVWVSYFRHWIYEPEPKALMHTSIFYDIRHVCGDASLTQSLLDYVSHEASQNTIFQAGMSGNALENTPPLGFFKRFVLEKDGGHQSFLDLKHRGTVPIIALIRLYALAEGVSEVSTEARLEALVDKKVISSELAGNLRDAHEFIASLRLSNQSQQIQNGEEVNNHLAPDSLSPLVRHQLKDAFAVVAESQRALKMRFGHGVL